MFYGAVALDGCGQNAVKVGATLPRKVGKHGGPPRSVVKLGAWLCFGVPRLCENLT